MVHTHNIHTELCIYKNHLCFSFLCPRLWKRTRERAHCLEFGLLRRGRIIPKLNEMSPKYGFWNASFFSFGKPLLIVAFLEQPIVPFRLRNVQAGKIHALLRLGKLKKTQVRLLGSDRCHRTMPPVGHCRTTSVANPDRRTGPGGSPDFVFLEVPELTDSDEEDE